jgi:hypothetical protein
VPARKVRAKSMPALRGILPELLLTGDLRVAVPALDRAVPGVPVPAEDLDRLLSHPDAVSHPDRGLARDQRTREARSCRRGHRRAGVRGFVHAGSEHVARGVARLTASSFQLVIDCADPEPLARFWVAALGYQLEPPPAGFDSWDEYWRDVGVPEDDLDTGADRIIDPAGRGPRIWRQVVPGRKAVKNRLHLDISVGGGRSVAIETGRQCLDAEASRLAGLGAVTVSVLHTKGSTTTGSP